MVVEATDRPDPEEAAELLEACIGLTGEECAVLLASRCAGREELRREVESLLGFLTEAEREGLDADRGDAATADRRVGLEIGGCRLLELVAIGGMGAVYRAEQASPRREVALKVLRSDGLGTDAWRRLKREAVALGRLDHPAIARVFTAGIHRDEHGATPFLTMELVDGGRPITAWWRTTGLPLEERLDRFATICEAIHHGHMKGVLHRDVKPANLLVGRDDRPKVIDFGIARFLEPGTDGGTAPVTAGRVIGTIAYMSPERLEGHGEIDVRTDVYGLGTVLYELLAGRMPFGESGSLAATAASIARGEPPRPSTFDRGCRGDLDAIVAKAMAFAPEHRYDSASALAADLRAHLAGEPIRARRTGRLGQVRSFLWRHRVMAAVVAGLFLSLAIGLVLSLRATANAERSLHLSLLAQGDLNAARNDPGGAWKVLRAIEPGRRDDWPVKVLERFADDSIGSAEFGGWNLFRGRLDAGRTRMIASGWGERPELIVLETDPARLSVRIPLPAIGMGCDWGRTLPDGTDTVIAGLADGRVVEVQASDGAIVRELARIGTDVRDRETGPVSDVALQPGGRWLAIAHSTDSVRLVDLVDGTEREFGGLADPAAPNWVFVEWSPDGASLAIAATGGTFVVDAGDDRISRLSRRSANHAAFSPDGSRIAIALSEGGAEIIERSTGTITSACPPLWPMWGVEWSPDGRFVALVGRLNWTMVIDPVTKWRRTFKSEINPGWTVRWLSEDRLMVLPIGKVFSLRDPRQILPATVRETEHPDRIKLRIRFLDGGSSLILTGPDGRVEMIDPLLETRREIARVPVTNASTAISPDAETIVLANGVEPGPLWIVRPREGTSRRVDGGFLGPLAISPDGRRTAAVAPDGQALVVDLATGTVEDRCDRPIPTKTIAFSWIDSETIAWCLPQGLALLVRDGDGGWSLRYKRDASLLEAWPGRDGEWYWTDLGSRIVRSSRERLGIADSGELTRGLGMILCLARHPHLPLIAVGTDDGRVSVFDESMEAVVSNFSVTSRRTSDLAWSPDGTTLAAIDVRGAIQFLDSEPLAARWPEIVRRRKEAGIEGGRLTGSPRDEPVAPRP